MNRGLIGFLVFLAVLVLGFGVAAFVLGPNVLAFIFHSERRTEPVVIVNLVDFVDAAHAQAYRDTYEAPAAALIGALGGRELWRARADNVVSGQVLDSWPLLQLVQYPSRAAFIELVTSGDYRALQGARDAAVNRSAMLSADAMGDLDAQQTPAVAVRLLTAARDDSLDTYDAKWLADDDVQLQRHGGKLLWRTRMKPLAADDEQQFDALLVYGFTDARGRSEWVSDVERETLQTLQRRLFRRDVLVLAETLADGPPGRSVEAPSEVLESGVAPADGAGQPVDKPIEGAATALPNTLRPNAGRPVPEAVVEPNPDAAGPDAPGAETQEVDSEE